MNEETRLQFQHHYHSVCRERGWMSENGVDLWPTSPEERAAMARELFGLALIFGTDSVFQHAKEKIEAESLNASPTLKGALNTLKAMNDEQKAATLALVDDVLQFAVYQFTIQLDRFDHGLLSLRFQNFSDDKCKPEPGTEVAINPLGDFEMFEDAPRWKEQFSRGASIGRPE